MSIDVSPVKYSDSDSGPRKQYLMFYLAETEVILSVVFESPLVVIHIFF